MHIFSPDSPLMRILDFIADILILSMFLVVGCLPIVTAGGAIIAAHKIAQDHWFNTEQPLTRRFFSTLKKHILPGLGACIPVVIMIPVLLFDYYYFSSNAFGVSSLIILFILTASTLIIFGSLSWLFPLIARYQNSFLQYIRLSLALAVNHPFRTLSVLVINLLPFLLLLISPVLFAQTALFWIIPGAGVGVFLSSWIQSDVFCKLEQNNQ